MWLENVSLNTSYLGLNETYCCVALSQNRISSGVTGLSADLSAPDENRTQKSTHKKHMVTAEGGSPTPLFFLSVPISEVKGQNHHISMLKTLRGQKKGRVTMKTVVRVTCERRTHDQMLEMSAWASGT